MRSPSPITLEHVAHKTPDRNCGVLRRPGYSVLIQTETAVQRSYRNRSAEIMHTAIDLKQILSLKRDCHWDISETALEIHMEGFGG